MTPIKTRSGILVFAVVFGLCMSSCFDYKTKSNRSNEELKLPDGSFWVKSTEKRGIWVNVEYVHNHKNNAIIALYDENTKELIERKLFDVICDCDPSEFIWIENLEEQIISYDNGTFRFEFEKCWLQ